MFDAEKLLAEVEGLPWQVRRSKIGKAIRDSGVTEGQLKQLDTGVLIRLTLAAGPNCGLVQKESE